MTDNNSDSVYAEFVDYARKLVDDRQDQLLQTCKESYQESGKGALALTISGLTNTIIPIYLTPEDALKTLTGTSITNHLPEAIEKYDPKKEAVIYCVNELGYSCVFIIQEQP